MQYFDIPNTAFSSDEYAERKAQDDAFMAELNKLEKQRQIRKGYSDCMNKWGAIIEAGGYTPEQLQMYVKAAKHWYRHRDMYGKYL